MKGQDEWSQGVIILMLSIVDEGMISKDQALRQEKSCEG